MFGNVDMSEIMQGLQIAGVGLATVFAVLIIFFILTKVLLKAFPDKEET